MRVKFWGTRGSIASPGKDTLRYGGNTTCLEFTLESGRKVIVDAGSGIRKLGIELSKQEEPLKAHLLMTHIHWDHIIGFPFFAPLYQKGTKIMVDGCARALNGLRNIFNNQYVDGTFPVGFDDIMASIEPTDTLQKGTLTLDDVKIDATELQHPQGGMGFRFREEEKVLIFLTDNELREDAWPGRTRSDFIHFSKDAEVLIHDCQYVPEEMKDRRGWGHSDFESVMDMAIKAHIKKLYLFHHDPERTDKEVDNIVSRLRKIARHAGSSLSIEGAKEGSSFLL
jgi:phosphoribosyl 1,2-cyclic phosphodiesterase